jgi:predicted DNA-binding transcriptional regulator AlpA
MQMMDIAPDTRLTLAEWCQLIGIGGDQDRVFTVPEWAKEAAISLRTARELISTGAGPPVVELSPGRLGIRVCDHRAWLAARTRKSRAALRAA